MEKCVCVFDESQRGISVRFIMESGEIFFSNSCFVYIS